MNGYDRGSFQDLFPDFAQTPALLRNPFCQCPHAVHHLVRVEAQQQADLIATHHLLHSGGTPAGRGQVHIERVFQLAHVAFSLAPLAVQLDDALRVPVFPVQRTDQKKVVQNNSPGRSQTTRMMRLALLQRRAL